MARIPLLAMGPAALLLELLVLASLAHAQNNTNTTAGNYTTTPGPATAVQLMPGCECTGDNSGLGAAELAKHGADYGKWCAAWEDGKCSPDAKASDRSGSHTCSGTNASSCEAHWGNSYDFSKEQSWCCDSWCYVNKSTCTPDLQKKYGIKVAQSWTKTDVWYSYEVYPDPWTKPSELLTSHYTPQSYSQYNTSSCPYQAKTTKTGTVEPPAPQPVATIVYSGLHPAASAPDAPQT